MQIVLSKEEYDVLARLGGSALPTPSQRGEKFKINLPNETADTLRDRCGDELAATGFDANYAPTPTGRVLEGLIDKLFVV
jgi:hypothetical protein